MVTKWTPLACLSALARDNALPNDHGLKVALVVVNMPLDGMVDKFMDLSNIATVKAFTDGGASQVCRIFGKERYLPDFVSGDFDSVDPDLLNFYKEKGVEVIPTPDQDETDFTKCLRIITSKQHIDKFDQIVAINAFGKRLDQTMANIETLFHVAKVTKKPVFLMSEDSLAFLLTPSIRRTEFHPAVLSAGKARHSSEHWFRSRLVWPYTDWRQMYEYYHNWPQVELN